MTLISSSGRMAFFFKPTVSHSVIVMLLFICFAEALEANSASNSLSASSDYMRRRKRFFGCPTLRLICPTQEQYFVVRSKWEWRHFRCKLQASVLDTALKECDISPMDQCKEKWLKKDNNCSVKVTIVKKILDRVFHPACTLHDLCYSSLNATRHDCDKWFIHNLKEICSMKKLSRLICEGTIRLMHRAVRWFGKQYFDNGQDWAKENCTSESSGSGSKSSIFEHSGGGSGSGGKLVVIDQSGSGNVPV